MIQSLTRADVVAIIAEATRVERARIADQIANKPFAVQTFTLTLTTEKLRTAPLKLGFPFKSLFIQDASDVYAEISVVIGTNDSLQSAFTMRKNSSIEFDYPQTEANIYWAAQSGKTITVVAFTDAKFRSGSQISVTGGGVSLVDGSSATLATVTLVAATAAAIAPADTEAKVRTIYNGTGGTLYVGPDSTVLDTTGIPVSAGASLTWRNTAVLYGYSAGGGDVRRLTEK